MLLRISLALVIAVVAACGNGGGGSPDGPPDTGTPGPDSPTGFMVNGAVVGTAIPAGAKAVVVWTVSSGSPDYLYKFGEGASSTASFTMTLGADPPAAAINAYGIGVGVIALVNASTQLPDGMVDENQLTLLGITTGFGILWKNPAGPGRGPWSGAFPAGYACGRCIRATGGGFDSFEPVACTMVQIETAPDPDTLDVCNWT
jgi:hypothetical protein